MNVKQWVPAVAVLALTALAAPSGATASTNRPSSCFWEGPISTTTTATNGFDGKNFNFPESAATYWFARFHLPAGAHLVVRGRYAHARYESLNAYNSGGEPIDALRDTLTQPDPGATNPFVAGHDRTATKRGYTVSVLGADVPAAGRAANTVYAGATAATEAQLLYRVYLPDDVSDRTGGGGLPDVALVTADGQTLTGAAACQAVNQPDRTIPVVTTPLPLWKATRATPGCPATFPALPAVRWERFFSLPDAVTTLAADCRSAPAPTPKPADVGGYYSNGDIRYLFTYIDRRYGPVLVLRGRMPSVATTSARVRRMPAGQLRYWSVCSYESRVTTRYGDCLADRDVPVTGKARDYTIVVSRAADRPRNATARCGVAWLAFPARGDGAGDRDLAQLVIRNMLPAAGFTHAAQDVTTHGTEKGRLGAYLPTSTYTTKKSFQARGCAR
jgi:hypothetical protein